MKLLQLPICDVAPVLRLTAFCTAFLDERPAGYSSAGEAHDFWESVFILQGEAEITAGERIYRLVDGQMIFHPPIEFHRLRNAGERPLRFIIISFTADPFPLCEHRICSFPAASTVVDCVQRLRKLFVTKEYLLCDPPEDKRGDIQRAVNLLENFFLDLLERKPLSATAMKDAQATLYSRAVSVMYEHLAGRLCAAEISRLCGMSVSAMQKLFFKYTGMGMMQYYNDLRMHHARHLLESGMRVGEVAAQLGFDDQNYFSTAFRRRFGEPPSAVKGDKA